MYDLQSIIVFLSLFDLRILITKYMTAHLPGLIPVAHKYMTAHLPGLVQALSINSVGAN
jgi:hypothetical protein